MDEYKYMYVSSLTFAGTGAAWQLKMMRSPKKSFSALSTRSPSRHPPTVSQCDIALKLPFLSGALPIQY